MFIKIRTPKGDWDIREAKQIKYSSSSEMLTPDRDNHRIGIYSAYIPTPFVGVFESCGLNPLDIEHYPFSPTIIYEYSDIGGTLGQGSTSIKCHAWRNTGKITEDYLFSKYYTPSKEEPLVNPACWEGRGYPLYNYAILDNSKAIVFPTEAYIINDDGKTIAKIGG